MDDHKLATFTRPWSDLPKEIISKIEKCLRSAVDVSQMHSVCNSWHASRNPNNIGILSPFLPCTIPNASLPFTDRAHAPVTLIARAVFLVAPLQSSPSTPSWLLTVEEMVPHKLRILYPLSNNQVQHPPSNFPKYLDLSKFRVSEVAKSYCFKYSSDYKDVVGVKKVVVCAGSTPTAMVLYGKGVLVGVRLKNGKWGYVRDSFVRWIKDVICFKGMIYATDCYLDVMVIDYKTMNIVVIYACGSDSPSSASLHLMELKTELHLVEWSSVNSSIQLNVHKFDKITKTWDPKNGLRSGIVFVSLRWCFVVNTLNNDGKYIVCTDDCFTSSDTTSMYSRASRLFEDARIDVAIGVFSINTGKQCKDTSLRNYITRSLWPPPVWFWPKQFTCFEDDVNDEESPSHSAMDSPTADFINNQDSVAKTVSIDTHTTKSLKALNQVHSTMVFEGFNIKTNLVPTLRKVWEKYGNILKKCKIRNADMIATALESLALALLILQTYPEHSLNKIQLDYLSSVLLDLQHMNFQIEWLLPSVEKALAVHKNKHLKDSSINLDQANALVEQMKQKILGELAKSEELPVLQSMDSDQREGAVGAAVPYANKYLLIFCAVLFFLFVMLFFTLFTVSFKQYDA